MSVFLQFDKSKMVPAGTAEDWDAFTEWTSDCDDYAPDVLEFLENGESEQLPAITEQLALAHSCRPPESKRLNQHVVNVLKAIEESNAMRVDLLNDEPDESDFGEAIVSMSKSIADLTSQLAEQQKAHKADIQKMIDLVQATQQRPEPILPQPAFNFTVGEKAIQFIVPPEAFKLVVNVAPAQVTAEIQQTPVEVHPHIEVQPAPVTVESHNHIEIPADDPQPFDIEVERDPDTGLATRFNRVPNN